jgi:hypothetical protein
MRPVKNPFVRSRVVSSPPLARKGNPASSRLATSVPSAT